MLRGSSVLSEFRTSLSKVLTPWHCVKVKQRYQYVERYTAEMTRVLSSALFVLRVHNPGEHYACENGGR